MLTEQGNHFNVFAKSYDTGPADGDYSPIIEFSTNGLCF